MYQRGQFQLGIPLTAMVKRLIVVNLALWVGLVLILQNYFLDQPYIFTWFGFTPATVIYDFWLWQLISYMFVHSQNVFHVVFNMILLWFMGGELEQRWGGRFFLLYYFVCGVGAALLYLGAVWAYALFSGDALVLQAPVVGASGAIYGLMLAYAWFFGERTIYFMMMFPMKARTFVIFIGVIELLNLLSSGVHSQTANLAHLGGLVAGFIFLKSRQKWDGHRRSRAKVKHGRGLKLVVNNEVSDRNSPRYWN